MSSHLQTVAGCRELSSEDSLGPTPRPQVRLAGKTRTLTYCRCGVCGSRVLLFGVLLVVFAQPVTYCEEQEAQVKPIARTKVGGEFIIHVTNASTSETASQTLTVAVSDKAKEVFADPDAPLNWNPREFLPQTRLTCLLSGQSLSVGDGATAEEDLYVTYNIDRITRDQPGSLTLTVARPQSLHPGIYQGELKARFWSNEKLNAIIEGFWPVTIIVHGRRLHEVVFESAASDGSLRVGRSASVTATFDTIGCELGTGRFEMDYVSPNGVAQKALYLAVPSEKPLDPFVAFRKDDASVGCHPYWRDYVVRTETRQVSKEIKELPEVAARLHCRYTVTIHAGDCFEPGHMRAKLRWPQDETAPRNLSKQFEMTAETPIHSGILVFPKLCYGNEAVQLRVQSHVDLGSTIDLQLIGPHKDTQSIRLKRRSEREVSAAGSTHSYFAVFRPNRTGPWSVTWSKNDQKLPSVLGEPRAFRVLFGLRSNLEKPLTVFASPTPVGWGMWSAPYKGHGWNETRPEAFSIAYDNRFLSSVVMHKVGFYRGRPFSSLRPYNTDDEPILTVVPETGDQEADHWTLPTEGWLSFDASVSVEPKGVKDHPRHVVGVREYVYRTMLCGVDDRNRPVARILQVPIRVDVTNAWQIYRRWMVWILALILLLVLLVIVYLKASPRPRRMSRSTTSILTTGPTDQDEMDTFAANPKRTEKKNRKTKDRKGPPPDEPQESTKEETLDEPFADTPPDVDDDDDLSGFV